MGPVTSLRSLYWSHHFSVGRLTVYALLGSSRRLGSPYSHDGRLETSQQCLVSLLYRKPPGSSISKTLTPTQTKE